VIRMTQFHKILIGAALACGVLLAQDSGVLPPLPKPLVLPPGNDQILPIAKSSSYLGDAIRIVDCPDQKDQPFGTCGNLVFGGPALFNTHLSGLIRIRFDNPVNNVAHFTITHPNNIVGDDVFMSAPQLYEYGIGQNRILDDFDEYSQGDLNLITGEVTNLNYIVFASNSFHDLMRSNGASVMGNSICRFCCVSRARAFAISVFTHALLMLASERMSRSLS